MLNRTEMRVRMHARIRTCVCTHADARARARTHTHKHTHKHTHTCARTDKLHLGTLACVVDSSWSPIWGLATSRADRTKTIYEVLFNSEPEREASAQAPALGSYGHKRLGGEQKWIVGTLCIVWVLSMIVDYRVVEASEEFDATQMQQMQMPLEFSLWQSAFFLHVIPWTIVLSRTPSR